MPANFFPFQQYLGNPLRRSASKTLRKKAGQVLLVALACFWTSPLKVTDIRRYGVLRGFWLKPAWIKKLHEDL